MSDLTIQLESYQIVSGGEALWQGDSQELAALIAGMAWEEVGVNSQTPTHRRLVSALFPMDAALGLTEEETSDV